MCIVELETKVIQRFLKISLSRRRAFSCPNRGLLRDCEIFRNLQLTFVPSSNVAGVADDSLLSPAALTPG